MAGSVNKVILIGNLGQDPEVKSFQNGGRIANLRIATSESWKDRQTGERKERTEWHSVTAWGKLAEYAAAFRKGAHIMVEGELRAREYSNAQGATVHTYEIVANTILNLRPGQRAPQEPEAAPVDEQPTEPAPESTPEPTPKPRRKRSRKTATPADSTSPVAL